MVSIGGTGAVGVLADAVDRDFEVATDGAGSYTDRRC